MAVPNMKKEYSDRFDALRKTIGEPIGEWGI